MKSLFKTAPPSGKAIRIYVFKVVVLALTYHLAARLGLKMAYVQSNTSPVWPPTGIALATLLIFGYRYWPGIRSLSSFSSPTMRALHCNATVFFAE